MRVSNRGGWSWTRNLLLAGLLAGCGNLDDQELGMGEDGSLGEGSAARADDGSDGKQPGNGRNNPWGTDAPGDDFEPGQGFGEEATGLADAGLPEDLAFCDEDCEGLVAEEFGLGDPGDADSSAESDPDQDGEGDATDMPAVNALDGDPASSESAEPDVSADPISAVEDLTLVEDMDTDADALFEEADASNDDGEVVVADEGITAIGDVVVADDGGGDSSDGGESAVADDLNLVAADVEDNMSIEEAGGGGIAEANPGNELVATAPRCGDGTCNGDETPSSCSEDCQRSVVSETTAEPGGVVAQPSTPSSSISDGAIVQPGITWCGDGECNGSETSSSCSEDCQTLVFQPIGVVSL